MRGTAVLVPLFLVAGCAPDVAGGGDASEVADEAVTEFTDGVVEESDVVEEDDAEGGGPIAVELPGLPVGGEGALFTEPSTQCVSVNLTGDPLPDGVWVTVTAFAAPDQFAIVPGSCGLGLPGCLDGAELSTTSGPCEVAVAWNGEGESGTLAVAAARARCETTEWCEQALATVSGATPQDIELVVQPAEEQTGAPVG